MPLGQLLLLTGSPGSGKTTVAPLVADHADQSCCLNLDLFFASLRTGAIDPWKVEAHQQNRVVLSAAASAVATFTAGDYFTVAEGILYPFMLDLFAAACEPLGIVVNYAVLTAPLSTVLSRVQTRRAEPQHAEALDDEAVVGDLWSQFEAQGVDARHRIDSSQGTPQDIADTVYAHCIKGELRL
ncbi:MAG TPA: AAA family ATPase [Acidimicrobiales bacterium]|jgi:cytidylate kinase|nr:AAA family ATPase [Acidimicrobiales bacterium]